MKKKSVLIVSLFIFIAIFSYYALNIEKPASSDDISGNSLSANITVMLPDDLAEESIPNPEPEPEPAPEPEPEPFKEYDITLMALGDNLMHGGVIKKG